MKRIIFAFIFVMLVLPFVSADVTMSGYRQVQINNIITNVNELQDYFFVSACKLGDISGLKLVEDGKIESYYKFCDVSVYAIKKSDFNNTILNLTEKDAENFLSSKAEEVLTNIRTQTTVSITSTQKEITNYYTIELDKLKSEPDNQVIERNTLIYWYIGIPILALIIIIAVILIRRKKK